MEMKLITVRDVMREKHLDMDGMATVKEALDAMKTEKVDIVIVEKRSDSDAFGIVLLSDIAKKVLAKDKSPERTNVYEIMSKPVVSVDPDLDVRYCARLFDRFGISNAPVIENGQVVGIVSYNELIFRGLCRLIDE